MKKAKQDGPREEHSEGKNSIKTKICYKWYRFIYARNLSPLLHLYSDKKVSLEIFWFIEVIKECVPIFKNSLCK